MSQEAKVAGRMRQDWDERARRDAFHYIASWRKDWDPESFFASGEEDYQGLVAPVLSELSFDPAGQAMLELGCGAGRMTRSFARRFGRVFAFDVSAEMLGRAQALLDGAPNVIWVQGNGLDLSTIASGSVKFVFSYLVLQHLPEETLALRYIGEMLRVLSDGGVFLFQFNGSRAATMNWKGRLSWSLVDARVGRSVLPGRAVARLRCLDWTPTSPAKAGAEPPWTPAKFAKRWPPRAARRAG